MIPLLERITFEHGEIEKTITIQLLDKSSDIINDKKNDKDEEEEEEIDRMFKVIISNAEPNSVKISKKNCCLVTILAKEHDDIEKQKLYEYFLN